MASTLGGQPQAGRRNDFVDTIDNELSVFGHRIRTVADRLNHLLDRIDGPGATPMIKQDAENAPPPATLMRRIEQLSETILSLEQAIGRVDIR